MGRQRQRHAMKINDNKNKSKGLSKATTIGMNFSQNPALQVQKDSKWARASLNYWSWNQFFQQSNMKCWVSRKNDDNLFKIMYNESLIFKYIRNIFWSFRTNVWGKSFSHNFPSSFHSVKPFHLQQLILKLFMHQCFPRF